MMKKLFLWSALLMTGFAFYSCDDAIDNPVTGKQDPSNPNATWTYEVSVKFDKAQTYWDGETQYKFEAPQTLYVFNQNREQLGVITCNEKIDQDNYAEDYYKFAGTLKGAIGDTLIIGTIEDPSTWFGEKQDGTLATIFKNGILELAKAPIIVTNTSTGKIGTQNVKLQNCTFILGMLMSQYATGKEKYITITSDAIMIPEKTMTVTFAEGVDLKDKFWVAYPILKGINSQYFFKTTSEDGVDLFAKWDGSTLNPGEIDWIWWVNMWPKTIDLKKHVERFGNWIYISIDDLTITQSGDEAIDCSLQIYANGVTLKGINIKNSYFYVGLPSSKSKENTIIIEGENKISSNNWSWTVMSTSYPLTLKGNGTLSLTATYDYAYGIYIGDYTQYEIDEDNSVAIPASLTIEEGVTVKVKAKDVGVFAGSMKGNSYSYKEDGKWKEKTADENFENSLIINGTLEAEGDNQGVYKVGKILVAETGVLKATSNNAWQKILDATIKEPSDANNWAEAALETLVADKSKFSDETSEDKKVRTIKKK